jgi:OmpA-OmpF porin, OOP family
MNTGHQLLLTAFACAIVAVIAPGVFAADITTGAPSQEEIGRQLKTRGLPTLGTAPAPPPGLTPGVAPASTGSVPRPRETSHRSIHPPVSQPPTPPGASPSVTLRTITFEFGSAQLRPESVETLRNLGNALNQQLKDEKVFVIEGHTDRTGTRAYNDELSKRRADAVKDYLVKDMGVSVDRLQTEGKGFSEPANPRKPYAGENRRVVVVNLGA